MNWKYKYTEVSLNKPQAAGLQLNLASDQVVKLLPVDIFKCGSKLTYEEEAFCSINSNITEFDL